MSGSCCVERCDDPDCPVCTTVERGVAAPAEDELLAELGDVATRLGNPTRGGAAALAAERKRKGTSSRSRKGPTR